MQNVRFTLRNLFFSAALLFPFAGQSFAQGAGDTITAFNGAKIYVQQEQSKNLKLIAQALLFNLECSTGDAFRVGAGIEGDYILPKWASVHGAYIGSYFNLQKFNAKTLNKSGNDLTGFSVLEIGGRFHLLDRKGRARHKLILSQHVDYVYGGTVTTTHYIKAKFPCRRILAVRGGLYRSSAAVNTDMNKTELAVSNYGAVQAKDGTVFSDVYYTNAHTTGLYLGLSDIINLSVRTTNNVSGYSGTRYFTSFFREAYFDILMASTSFDPFMAAGKSYDIEPNTKGSFQTNGLGWRLGKKIVFTRKSVNVGYSFEIGNRPGVQGRGLFFGTGVTLAYAK
jgi:hypothetical protein